MSLDQIFLTGPQLGRVDDLFLTIRDPYVKRAALVFTNGKTDSRWLTKKPTVTGLLVSAQVDTAKKECSAVCLIDLYATLVETAALARGTVNPRQGAQTNAPDPRGFRLSTVLTVVHELGHVSQAWQFGQTFEHAYSEEVVSANVRADDALEEGKLTSAYNENPFEKGAFNFAFRFFKAHAREVNNGKFDFLLPKITMRGIFPDFPGAFQ